MPKDELDLLDREERIFTCFHSGGASWMRRALNRLPG